MTSRAAILEAARELLERRGWDGLTMRGLAAALGVGPTTLYHHVRDKQALLVLLLNQHLATRPRPDLPAEPRTRLVAAATELRDAMAAWPWAAEVTAVDGFLTLLDGSALWLVETIVAAAVDAGADEETAVAVFRNCWYLALGEVQVRARSARGRPEGSDPGPGFLARIDPQTMPHLAAIGPRWPDHAARDTFPAGLRAMVEGMLGATGTDRH